MNYTFIDLLFLLFFSLLQQMHLKQDSEKQYQAARLTSHMAVRFLVKTSPKNLHTVRLHSCLSRSQVWTGVKSYCCSVKMFRVH